MEDIRLQVINFMENTPILDRLTDEAWYEVEDALVEFVKKLKAQERKISIENLDKFMQLKITEDDILMTECMIKEDEPLFTDMTIADIDICPFCASTETVSQIDEYDDTELHVICRHCGKSYYIEFDPNSWDNYNQCYLGIDDICDHHNKSLFERAKKNG